MSLERVSAVRYVAPLREGGSLPGIVEGDDLGTYVCKFYGAGQGLRVLVAEVIVAGLVRALGLRTPRLVTVELTDAIARYEADEEVQDLLTSSLGLNLGVDFLPGSFGFDPMVAVEPDLAAAGLWLDAYVANVDRSWRNPNLLVWHGDLWLIDHGAALYFHHAWPERAPGGDPDRFASQPFRTEDHIFAAQATRARDRDETFVSRLTDDVLADVVAEVPAEWIGDAEREAYVAFLTARRDSRHAWLPGAER